jgi:putative transposase
VRALSTIGLRTDASYRRQERVRYADTSAALTALQREPQTAWLNAVSSVPTQQAWRHLDKAFRNFFAGRARYPTFRKKRERPAADYTTPAFRWDAEALTLAKRETPLAIRWSRPLPEGVWPSTVTVSRDGAGRYFVSILIEFVSILIAEELALWPPVAPVVGIDLGRHEVVVLNSGEQIGHPRFFQADEKRLATAQRRLAKQHRSASNRDKARRKVARIHARIADRPSDFLPKLATRLIRENQTICVERLRVKAMIKHPTLAKAIHDVGWGEFVSQLEYQALWYGRTLVKIDKIDKWSPSSQRCFACGHVLGSLSLDTRRRYPPLDLPSMWQPP